LQIPKRQNGIEETRKKFGKKIYQSKIDCHEFDLIDRVVKTYAKSIIG